ncbi:MAG: hypothetical protein JWP26_1268 [Devosia sp.]|nr:hypothetical protein [Devosia sp.]
MAVDNWLGNTGSFGEMSERQRVRSVNADNLPCDIEKLTEAPCPLEPVAGPWTGSSFVRLNA